MRNFDVAVVGGGLAGQIAALSLARGGRQIVLIAPQTGTGDRRTTALMDQSIRFMEGLGVWRNMEREAAPLQTMQILDGTQRLLRSPPVAFRAAEVDLPAFGYNFPNAAMLAVLERALAAEPNLTRLDSSLENLEVTTEQAKLVLSNGETVEAAFVVGADGRNSRVRESAGIDVRRWSYPQTALVLNFKHALPHRNVSTEFHTESGPFTQVPLPGNRSSLVWVMEPEKADRYKALPLEELSRHVEERMQSLLGAVQVQEGVQAWPLSGMMARQFGKGRIALVGEASHVFPPIGAQGLNLSLRDIMTLTEMLAQPGAGPVPADAGDRFDRRRRADIVSRTASVDLLNRSLLSDFLPVQMLRAAGLHLLSAVPPLRSLVMREGVEPGRGFRSLPGRLREKLSGKST